MNSEKRYRVGFVVTHPIQYLAPFFAHATRDEGLDMVGLYLSDFSVRGELDPGFKQSVKWDIDLLEGYEYQFMGKAASKRKIGGFFSMIALELWDAISTGRFDAIIIHGHNLAAHHVALHAARSAKVPVFARAETHNLLERPAWKNALRNAILKPWYKNFDGFLAIGSRNADYYRSMGIEDKKIFHAPYTVDNERFFVASRLKDGERKEIRERFGVTDEAPIIVYAAKFDTRKRPDDLIRAFDLMQKNRTKAWLLMVGSGRMDAELKSLVGELGTQNVVFPGFVNQSELPKVFAASDVFVLPSDNEPWGLAINEAMCAGLPVVLSDEIGCAVDLVQNGRNGFRFDAGDTITLSEHLTAICSDPNLQRSMSEESRKIMKNWSYKEYAAGVRAAIETTKRSKT